MEAAVHDYFKQGLAKSTDRVYSSAKLRFWSFCSHYNLVPIPLTETVLCKFAACLGREGLKFQTIKTYLAGIRHSHIEAGFPAPPPGAWPRLQLVLRGIRKQAASAPAGPRLPITPDILRLLHSYWSQQAQDPDTIMLWAACCVGFFAFLRSGEFTLLDDGAFDPEVSPSVGDVAVDSHSKPSLLRIR